MFVNRNWERVTLAVALGDTFLSLLYSDGRRVPVHRELEDPEKQSVALGGWGAQLAVFPAAVCMCHRRETGAPRGDTRTRQQAPPLLCQGLETSGKSKAGAGTGKKELALILGHSDEHTGGGGGGRV